MLAQSPATRPPPEDGRCAANLPQPRCGAPLDRLKFWNAYVKDPPLNNKKILICFGNSNSRKLFAKIGFDTAENELFKVWR